MVLILDGNSEKKRTWGAISVNKSVRLNQKHPQKKIFFSERTYFSSCVRHKFWVTTSYMSKYHGTPSAQLYISTYLIFGPASLYSLQLRPSSHSSQWADVYLVSCSSRQLLSPYLRPETKLEETLQRWAVGIYSWLYRLASASDL